MESYTKSVNTDKRSRKRLKFASSKERSKRASADVYRSYKRKVGVTSAATREEIVHNLSSSSGSSKNKRQKRNNNNKSQLTAIKISNDNNDRTAVLKVSSSKRKKKEKDDDVDVVVDDDDINNNKTYDDDDDDDKVVEEEELELSSTLAMELDVAIDRNASEIFAKFHRELWGLVRSLPEVLHHSKKIVNLMMSYLLSPASKPERPTTDLSSSLVSNEQKQKQKQQQRREHFVINHATTDILHLLSVLARDLRHEIHDYFHPMILPRIINDLLNPPLPPADSGKQPIPIDVTIVEAAFRTLSYLFRYDSTVLKDDLEDMRQYYGITIANRRELIRRLAAETFAPIIRKLSSTKKIQRHLRRVLRALAATAATETEGQQPITNALKRTQADGVDGISKLIFQLTKGVPGNIHSKGGHVVSFVISYCHDSSNKLIFEVTSNFLKLLCYHVYDENSGMMLEEIVDNLETAIKKSSSQKASSSGKKGKSDNQTIQSSIYSMVDLLAQVSSTRRGSLLHRQNDTILKNMFGVVNSIFDGDCFVSMPNDKQTTVLSQCCSIWTKLQDKPYAAQEMEKVLSYLFVHTKEKKDNTKKSIGNMKSMAAIISQELLSDLKMTSTCSAVVGSTIISGAAQISESSNQEESALLLILPIASRKLSEDEEESKYESTTSGRLFYPETGKSWKLRPNDKTKLLGNCYKKQKQGTKNVTIQDLRHWGIAMRCAPFLTLLSADFETAEESKNHHLQMSKWIFSILQILEETHANSIDGAETPRDFVIVQALALESLGCIMESLSDIINDAPQQKLLSKAKGSAQRLVVAHPKSIWSIRGAAAIARLLQRFEITFDNSLDELFERLMPNLRSSNHFLRLHTLEILVCLPKKAFVTDHADLEKLHDGDLDEETEPNATNKSSMKSGPIGICDIMETLLKLERLPVCLPNERILISLLLKVDMLGRAGKLPIVYAEAAANHMLGIFHIKFSPLWEVAGRALLSLAISHEKNAWPILESELVTVMSRSPTIQEEEPLSEPTTSDGQCLSSASLHHTACVNWEESSGKDVSLICSASMTEIDGVVPSHHTTDAVTVMESVWKVAEEGQQLLARNSRVVVPIFIKYLHCEYFSYYQNDPEKRELNLNESCGKTDRFERSSIDRSYLQRRLKCFLRVFAAVDGPQQLVHHNLLQKIFTAFLGNQDATVSQLALSALMKFKYKYLLPCGDSLSAFFQKGGLRNAILKLGEDIESGRISEEHRKMLVPVLTRILFGRLTAKGAKSAKDSPAARRAAIVSFLSSVCKSDTDLFPLLYLMTRSFIPKHETLKPIETHEESDMQQTLNVLLSIQTIELQQVPTHTVEGFLHLLESFISQLGHRAATFVPHLASIVAGLCKFAAVQGNEENLQKGDSNMVDEKQEKRLGSEVDVGEGRNGAVRMSSIRSLCYNRLSELFLQFGGSIDFMFLYASLWEGLQTSMELLPEMVVKSEKAPALLTLLHTMSTEASLIALLDVPVDPVCAVIKCIDVTSQTPCMNLTLGFIENLLTLEKTDGGSETESPGRHLLQKHMPLLLERFALRLSGGGSPGSTREKSRTSHNTMWRRELRILFLVSELVDDHESYRLKDKSVVLERLCTLLLVFLDSGKQIQTDDRMNVIGILKGIISHLGQEAVKPVFTQLSKSLSPYNARVGIESLQVRHAIASLLTALGNKDGRLKDVAETVCLLSAVHPKRVDEIDFEVLIPVMNKLGSTSDDCEWISLGSQGSFDRTLLSPVINYCFHYLHIEDAVLSRAAFNALKSVVTVASKRRLATKSKSTDVDNEDEWGRLLEASIIPLVKAGLHSRNVSVRRYYVLLIREIAMQFEGESSPHLLGDLCVLCDDENLDLDFFVNITHVQIHRRARGLQRFRKLFNESEGVDPAAFPITPPSLSNVILPLVIHPVFECETKAEETYALEAIATAGTIARLLPWKKYHATLWTVLTQFDRHPGKERYMVGLLCALVDGFHFELISVAQGKCDDVSAEGKSAVWRALENRIIPKIEGLLTKEKVDRNGTRIKTIRAAILLALLKLFQRFPESFFESRLPRILAVICDALASKDSDVRDIARSTLGKIVISMDLKYLQDVIREVTITLNEGYKLHVRAATIHTILQMLSSVYKVPTKDSDAKDLWFDKCVPALMSVVQDDLFGEANERRESRETNVRYVKEAGGTKSINTIEMMCKMIKFQPSEAKRSLSLSSVHCVVSPLLERLRLPDVDAKTIKKIREILSRVVIGLSHNPSVEADELLPFVYATLQPFIGAEKISSLLEKSNEVENDDDEIEDRDSAINVSGSNKRKEKKRTQSQGSVVEWRPSTLGTSGTTRDATAKKRESSKELVKVSDGASAPKLTGSGRHGAVSGEALKNPASISAVVFGLNMLNSKLKTTQIDEDDRLLSMMDPFVSLLTACVCYSNDIDVLVVAFKCIVALLRFELPAYESHSKLLGSRTLDFLTSSGSSLNQSQDLIQACFKTLAYLINTDRKIGGNNVVEKASRQSNGEDALAANIAMPLSSEQMKVLITTIQISLAESEQHNPALALIKAIMSRKYISPEFYVLMDSLVDLVVRSQKPSLRQQSAGIFIRFLLDFPMGEAKFEKHLRQVVANISYEHQEGRMSAINLLASLLEKMPAELLNVHSQVTFLPLVMQKANDNSTECREGVEKCLAILLTRCSGQVLRSCHEYTVRWSKSHGQLLVASLQVFGMFVDTTPDFLKKNDHVSSWVIRLKDILQSPQSDWEAVYFSVISAEKLFKQFDSYLRQEDELWIIVIDRMIDSHPWIKLATSRIIKSIVSSDWAGSFFSNNLGMLFKIIRNICFQLGADEKEQNDELSELDIKILTSLLPTICEQKHLCFSEDDKDKEETSNPVTWLMKRLSNVAKAKGSTRRMAIFKCYAAFVTKHTEIVAPYLELLLEPLHRSSVEASNEAEKDVPVVTKEDGTTEIVATEASLARDVIHIIEETAAESSDFLTAYASVKKRALEKKEERKSEAKVEAIRDPKAFAAKKMMKQEREKQRKKRRVEDRRRGRGASSKRRHFS